jgi:hypothetical protein
MKRRDMVLAGVLRWEAGDLIWGLWVSSLCVGAQLVGTTAGNIPLRTLSARPVFDL